MIENRKKITISYGFAVFLFLCGVMFLVSSCGQDDSVIHGEDPEMNRGELIAVNFTVSDKGFDENEVVTRNGDPAVTLRAAGPITSGSMVRVVVYNSAGYVNDATYTAGPGTSLNLFPTNSPGLTVPSGGNYRFVAYSYGTTTPMDPFTELPNGPIPHYDVMWGETNANIVISATNNVHITMDHLYSRIRLIAELGIGAPATITSFDLAVPWINAYSPHITLGTGFLDPGQLHTVAIFKSTSLSTTTTWVSELQYIFTNANMPTTIYIQNIEINGTMYPGPFEANYSKPLEPGKSYTLMLTLDRVSGGSADRISINGSGANAALKITRDPNDMGLFFKFGGVVGINGVTNTFINNIDFNPLANPALITAFNVGGTYSTYLPGVPSYAAEDWNRGVRNISMDIYHNLDSIRKGKGDPCRLIGMTSNEIRGFANDAALYAREAQLETQGIGGWRTPTILENKRFSGYTSNTTTPNHWWTSSTGTRPSPFGTPPVEGGEFPTRNSNNGSPDGSKFLPAPGWLHANSGILMPASFGFYWSNEPADIYSWYSLAFTETYVYPENIENQSRGFTVRCVKKKPNPYDFEVSVEDWVPGGSLGTPGGEGDVSL